jgi:hypothetical protein
VLARFKDQAERSATAAVASIPTTYGVDDSAGMGSHVYRGQPKTDRGYVAKTLPFATIPRYFVTFANTVDF